MIFHHVSRHITKSQLTDNPGQNLLRKHRTILMQRTPISFIQQDKTSLRCLLRAHPLHYPAILSQLLSHHTVQPDEVMSCHPVQSRNSVKSHMTISSLTHFIEAYSHCMDKDVL